MSALRSSLRGALAATCIVSTVGCSGAPGDVLRSPNEIYQDSLAKSVIGSGNNNVPNISSKTYSEVVKFNYILAQEFLRAADEARLVGKYANGVLIISAVAFALGDARGLSDETLTEQLIAGLGLSEGLRYFGPNVSSLAFLTAAEQSACLATVGASRSSDDLHASKGEEDAAALWEMMTIVQANLRRNLTRKHVNLVQLALGLVAPRSYQTEDYDLERAEQRLRAHALQEDEEETNPKDNSTRPSFRYRLLNCLTFETSGD